MGYIKYIHVIMDARNWQQKQLGAPQNTPSVILCTQVPERPLGA